jgi:4-amino-4-deoxychorismate lyase
LLRDIERVAQGDATAKVVVTRGIATRGYAPARPCDPTRVVAAFEPSAYPPSCAHEGVRVRRCSLVLSEQPRLGGAKTLNRLENVLARGEWHDTAIAEGLLADAADRLIGGTMTNVFVVKGDSIATPGLSRSGVAGAQRARVLELLEARGCAAEVRDVAYAELEDADEVFLTNSLIGVWPVARLDSREWVPGPRTRLVQRLVEEDDARVR